MRLKTKLGTRLATVTAMAAAFAVGGVMLEAQMCVTHAEEIGDRIDGMNKMGQTAGVGESFAKAEASSGIGLCCVSGASSSAPSHSPSEIPAFAGKTESGAVRGLDRSPGVGAEALPDCHPGKSRDLLHPMRGERGATEGAGGKTESRAVRGLDRSPGVGAGALPDCHPGESRDLLRPMRGERGATEGTGGMTESGAVRGLDRSPGVGAGALPDCHPGESRDLLRPMPRDRVAAEILGESSAVDSDAAADAPIACTLSGDDLAARKTDFIEPLFQTAIGVKELDDGYAVQFPFAQTDALVEYIKGERSCCAFMTYSLEFEAGSGGVWIVQRGPDGTKEFLRPMVERLDTTL